MEKGKEDELRAEIDELKRQLQLERCQNESHRKDYHYLSSQIEMLLSKNSRDLSIIKDAEITIDDYQNKFRNEVVEKEFFESLSTVVNSRLCEAYASIGKYTSRINGLENDIDHLKSIVARKDEELVSIQYDYKQLNNRLRQRERNIQDLKKGHAEHVKKLNSEYTSKIKHLQDSTVNIHRRYLLAEEKVGAKEKTFNSCQEQNKRLSSVLDRVYTDTQTQSKVIKELSLRVKELELENNELSKELDLVRARCGVLEDERDLEIDMTSNGHWASKVDELERDNKHLVIELERLSQSYDVLCRSTLPSMDHLKTIVARKDEELVSIQYDYKQLNNRLRQRERNIQDLKKGNAEHVKKLNSEYTSKIKHLQDSTVNIHRRYLLAEEKVDAKEKTFNSCQEHNKRLSSVLDRVYSDTQTQSKVIKELSLRVKELEVENNQLSKELELVRAKCGVLEDERDLEIDMASNGHWASKVDELERDNKHLVIELEKLSQSYDALCRNTLPNMGKSSSKRI